MNKSVLHIRQVSKDKFLAEETRNLLWKHVINTDDIYWFCTCIFYGHNLFSIKLDHSVKKSYTFKCFIFMTHIFCFINKHKQPLSSTPMTKKNTTTNQQKRKVTMTSGISASASGRVTSTAGDKTQRWHGVTALTRRGLPTAGWRVDVAATPRCCGIQSLIAGKS